MKLTDKIEAEVMQVYDTWLNSYLSGNVVVYNFYLDADYRFIGSTNNEEFLSRPDTTNFFETTAAQLAGKTEIRNSTKTIQQFGDLIFITHLFDAWFLNVTEWNYYGRFRFTSALKENEEGWRFIYQHFSMPDSKAQEGETIGYEKISAENLRLREAIKRRTIEIENKNRELEIEVSLEKVRSRSLAMYNTSELQAVIHAVHQELLNLNIAVNGGSFIAINSDVKTQLRCWGSGGTANTSEEVQLPMYEKPFCTNLINGIKKGSGFFTEAYTQEEKIEFFKFLFKYEPWSKLDAKKQHEILASRGGYTRSCSVSQHTSIFIVNQFGEQFSNGDNDILQRFGKVFEQAYTRFLDLQKAEGQAREAQIEAALEKVRSRTMGMQRSEELKEAAQLLFQQVQTFGVDQWACGYNIWEPDGETCMAWMSRQGILQPPFKTYPSVDHCFQRFYDAKQKGQHFYVEEIGGDEIKEHYKRLLSLPEFKSASKEFFDEFIAPEFQIFHITYFAQGYLMFITYKPLPEMWDIFKRFGKVFEQTYTRFLDLQKAEAQTREAQIETALEKVRSRSLGMHKSNELQSVVTVVFEKLKELGVSFDGGVGIQLFTENSKDSVLWIAAPEQIATPSCINLPYVEDDFINNPIILDIWKAKETASGIYNKAYNKEEKNKYFNYLFKYNNLIQIPQAVRNEILQTSGYTQTFIVEKNSCVLANSWSGEAFSQDDFDIFKRIAKVFEQAYIRFLDLQKAEAQAREAQIQLALERVRARTMAMQHSDELREIAAAVHDQLQSLGFTSGFCSIVIMDRPTGDMTWWMFFPGKEYPESYLFPFVDHPFYLAQLNNWKQGEKYSVIEVSGEEKKSYDKYSFSQTEFIKIPIETQRFMMAFEKITFSNAYMKHGALSWGVEPINEENSEVLQRFASVFEQCYTRFLDLQKAEAQTREAEIQLALERVRARTMAMRYSTELSETASELFRQLKKLGAELWTCGFALCEKNNELVEKWMGSPITGHLFKRFVIPCTANYGEQNMYDTWQKGVDLFTFIQEGEELKEIYKELMTLPTFRENYKELIESGISFPTWQKFHIASYKYGYLLIITTSLFKEENIFTRFAQVFEQTYTRFLDLQKAEAQAREAEIELALERVRARTMAMQHSDELQEASFLLDQQVRALGIKTWGCAFNIYRENDSIEWFGNEKGVLPVYTVPRKSIFKKYYELGQKGNSIHVQEIAGKKCIDHYEYMCTLPVIGEVLKQLKKTNGSFPDYQIDHVVYFKYGYLLFVTVEQVSEAHDIFKRFAKVFEQTYTRFLDLQKAEAQAREAQIEAAVERVRSQSMAMYKTTDLYMVNEEILSQLNKLKVEGLAGVSIYLVDENDVVTVWDLSSPGNISNPNSYSFKYDAKKYPILGGWVELWKTSKEDYFVLDFPKEVLIEGVKELEEILPEMAVHLNNAIESGKLHHQWNPAGRLSDGILSIDLVVPPTEDTKSIVSKMAGAFNLAYQRFLDLQKAESQAKEAQIEAALERVRSRSMAMHKSDELKDVIIVVFETLKNLGLVFETAGIQLFTEGSNDIVQWVASPNLLSEPSLINLPFIQKDFEDSELVRDVWMAKEKGIKMNNKSYSFDEKNNFFEYAARCNDLTQYPQHVRDIQKKAPGYKQTLIPERHSALWVDSFSNQTISAEGFNVLERTGKVFEQTYTRFLDLQKAEAQAREAQIELALERVRAMAMAMQKSNELKDLIATVSHELATLDFAWDRCFIIIFDQKTNGSTWWMSHPESLEPSGMVVKYHEHPPYLAFVKAWQERKLKWEYVLENDVKKTWDEFLFNETELTHLPLQVQANMRGLEQVYFSSSFNTFGCLSLATLQPLSRDLFEIMLRFAKVFDLTYTRFNDLQQAEAQAREAQIQLALERVRARTMAMQHSNELAESASLLFQQVKSLGIETFSSGFTVWHNEDKDLISWMCNADGSMNPPFVMPINEDIRHIHMYQSWKSGNDFFVDDISGDAMQEHYSYLRSFALLDEAFNTSIAAGHLLPNRQVHNIANFSLGNLLFITYEPIPEAHEIFKRFAKVFEQTYTRFLDLQKAEAQAREAQIEVALERVRSRTMAMHKSDELQEVSKIIIQQIVFLNFPLFGFGIHICRENEPVSTAWIGDPTKGQVPTVLYEHTHDSLSKLMYKGWKDGESILVKKVEGEELKEHFEYMMSITPLKSIFETATPPEFIIYHFAYFSHGFFVIAMLSLYVEAQTILKRFAKVFEQTYTRFLDLQKAEAQAREAQINLAVERVRARALAMFKSEEILEVVFKLKEEVMSLDIPSVAAASILLKEKNGMFRNWDLTSLELQDESMHITSDIVFDLYKTHPDFYLRKVWENGIKYSVVVQDITSLNISINWLRENNKVKEAEEAESFIKSAGIQKVYHPTIPLNNGRLCLDLLEPPTEEIEAILLKMGAAFDLAYKRFEDLKNSEDQLREAKIEAALEKVRSRAMAMYKSDELTETVTVLFEEFKKLSTEPNEVVLGRGFIIIMNEPQQCFELWITDRQGKEIKQFFKIHFSELTSGKPTYQAWLNKQPHLIIDLDGGTLQKWLEYLSGINFPVARNLIGNRSVNNLIFHTKGFIGITSSVPLTKESIVLLERFAKVFEQTYTRFLDLQKAEAQTIRAEQDLQEIKNAKQKAEEALTELQVTQKQLIQSEKMASLGELTAGIAHEIQNPLNFVNNFSEVSNELIDEMNEELNKGDIEEAKLIAADVKQNLDKINQHGKRAADIVKGMLQHSRSSSGVKEPTDINALCDEYLRLSYHGLRAKDKSFNATMKTDFDESIGMINIIPQDIGRVVLNLLTNAFYVVNEKKKSGIEGYEPCVSISTKNNHGNIEIRVTDNGKGIPSAVKDKIFQPFFTTKPTGEGTGLGLSLSYDIIKAHGGELKVETKEGEGTTFIMQLPVI